MYVHITVPRRVACVSWCTVTEPIEAGSIPVIFVPGGWFEGGSFRDLGRCTSLGDSKARPHRGKVVYLSLPREKLVSQHNSNSFRDLGRCTSL